MKILDFYIIFYVISHFDIVLSKAALELQKIFQLRQSNPCTRIAFYFDCMIGSYES